MCWRVDFLPVMANISTTAAVDWHRSCSLNGAVAESELHQNFVPTTVMLADHARPILAVKNLIADNKHDRID
jgi:hypothetical protein